MHKTDLIWGGTANFWGGHVPPQAPQAPLGDATVCISVVEHWSSNPEDAGSIPSQKALELHFSQLLPLWVL